MATENVAGRVDIKKLFLLLKLNVLLSYFHFAATFLAALCMYIPMQYNSTLGHPRSYNDYSAWNSLKYFMSGNVLISIISSIALLAQLIFILNLTGSIIWGRHANSM